MAIKSCLIILIFIILSSLPLYISATSRSLGVMSQSLSQSQSSIPPPPPPPPRTRGGHHGPNQGHYGLNHGHHRTVRPPPPETPAPVPERLPSLDDLVKALKKSPNCAASTKPPCSKGRLVLPGLQGNGILVTDSAIVSKDGSGDFPTIGEAIETVPEDMTPEDGFFVIYTKKGVYEEYIDISRNKKNILLLGDGINQTIVTGNHSDADGLGASNSATFAISGDRFTAINVTFRNTYGPGSQAVAVRNRADLSAFYRCSFEGYQDTLYAHSHVQFYRDCDIYGTIDFILGNAAAVFQNCRILGRARGGRVIFTANGREGPGDKTAYSFHNCTIDAAPDLAAEPRDHRQGSAYLGRPWKPYARVVYMQSYIGDVVNQSGWLEWDGEKDDLDTVYYGEYRNYGPGSSTRRRVNWPGVRSAMTDSEAALFTVQNLTDGGSWLPDTGIPFSLGLI